PDVVDALLFVSPTPFSVWGVLAMWAVFGAGLLVALRKVLRMKYPAWHRLHIALVAIAVTGTIVHALRIEGLLEMNSKIALSVLVAGALMIGVVRNERKRLAVRRRSHLPG
ncbi:MAG: ferric reductase, partial [Pseudomonadota bacterium]